MKLVSVFLAAISLFLLGIAATTAQEQPTDPLANTRWQLLSYGQAPMETAVFSTSAITLLFGDDLHISGNGGCNGYSSGYSANNGAIAFEMVISTMMACADDVMAQELAYFEALQTSTSYEIVNNQLILTYEGGQLVFMALTLVNTEWQLVAYGATDTPVEVIGATPITLAFADDNTLSGSGGCNNYGGNYTNAPNNSISFTEVYSTEMACMETGVMEQEQTYFSALGSANIYDLTATMLRLNYADGQLVFQRVYQIVNTSWQLVSFDDTTSVIENSIVTITFDEAFYIGGSGGCNDYGGRYGIRGNTISFYEVITTMMACADNINAQEGSFFFGLEKATTYEISADELVIYYGDGAKMTFTRIENPYSE